MANTQALKRRIGSVKNTKQITKAMELVAASKMRRAQQAAVRTRAYQNTAREILARLQKLNKASDNALFDVRPVTQRLYIVITSDRGLAGAYNGNVLRLFNKQLVRDEAEGVSSHAIAIGKKASNYCAKLEAVNLIGVYTDFSDRPTVSDIAPILNSAKAAFLSNKTAQTDDEAHAELNVDEVVVIYTDFKSSVVQVASVQQLFPAAIRDEDNQVIEDTTRFIPDINDVVFEPSPQAVLEKIVPKLIEAQLMQSVLESIASEHSSRMLAMKNASDNAGDLIDDLTLAFNGARQASITQELAEIAGGSVAVN